MMKALIIGITSCSGSHLAEHLLDIGYQVFGAKRKSSSLNNIQKISDNIDLFDIDLNSEKSVTNILRESCPDQIYFLVAANHFQNINTIYNTNIKETVSFFESAVRCSCNARILLISSSAVYGVRDDIRPLTEEDKLLPSMHYGLSKVFQEQTASYYFRNFNLDVIIARPFNFTGPRELPSYVCTDFAKQIVDIERSRKEPVIKVGNLQNKRDIADIRDIVKGYETIVTKGIKGETYNVCSSQTYSIQSILDKLLSLSKVKIEIKIDPNKIRSSKTNFQVGDSSKIRALTGWKPEIPFDKTLENVLKYCRMVY